MKKAFLILLLFLIVTFVFMHPVILNMKTRIAGFYSTDEPYGVIWSFWWAKFAHLTKRPTGLIDILASPFGIQTISIPFFPLWAFMAKYISIFFNEIAAYNLLLLLTFVFSAGTMYWLMFYLTRDRGVSIFSALIYSFCPFHFVRVWQHFGTAQIQWMPLVILLLIKLREDKKVKTALYLGLSLALNHYFDTHYVYFMFIVTGLFLVLELFSRDSLRDKFIITLLFSFAIFISLSIILPSLAPFLKKIAQSKGQPLSAYTLERPFEDLFGQSARPLSYLLPFTEHPVFGSLTNMFVGTNLWGESLTEHNLFLGFIPLALTVIAIRQRKSLVSFMKRRGREISLTLKFFIFLVAVAWLFSQPPWWSIFKFKLYMPSFFMYKILPVFRAYVRFGIVVMLGVSVLAGLGLQLALKRFKTPMSKAVIVFLVCSFSLYEFWSNPKEHVIDLSKTPRVYDWLKEQRGDFTISEYPLDIKGVNEVYKFYQTKHQKKIINATLPGTDANMIARGLTKLSSPRTQAMLKWMAVKYILVHLDDYKNSGLVEDMEELKNIHNTNGLKLSHTLENIEVYQLR